MNYQQVGLRASSEQQRPPPVASSTGIASPLLGDPDEDEASDPTGASPSLQASAPQQTPANHPLPSNTAQDPISPITPHDDSDVELASLPNCSATVVNTSPTTPALAFVPPKAPSRAMLWLWWWEVGGTILSIICILLIFAILLTMHGRPLSKRTLKISLNTAVSVLATVGKSGLLVAVAECISQAKWPYFDAPQRLNDLQIFDSASRGPWGALMLLLQSPGRVLLAALGALIIITSLGFEPAAQQMISFPNRRSLSPNQTASLLYATGWTPLVVSNFSGLLFSPSYALQRSAVNSFIGTVNEGYQTCPTSDCTFPDFESFSLCVDCRNALPEVTRSSVFYPNTTYQVVTFKSKDSFYKPVNLQWNPIKGLFPFEYNVAFAGGQIALVNDSTPDTRRFGILAVNSTDVLNRSTDTVSACDFRWCAKSYRNVHISNGVFAHDPIDVIPLDLQNRTGRTTVLRSQNASVPSYEYDAWAEISQWVWVNQTFIGNAYTQYNVMLAAGENSNITAEHLADGISNFLRTSANKKVSTLAGQAYILEPYVHIHWPWLIWPASMTILSAILLLATALRTKDRPDRFKSSVLALMYHGLSGFSDSELDTAHIHDSEPLEKMAKKVKTILTGDARGNLKFKKV